MSDSILVSFFLGSSNDIEKVRKGLELLEKWQLSYRLHTLSAHRTPEELESALQRDILDGSQVVIAAAGMAAHLPGVIASKTTLPVIGIPLSSGSLGGVDALYSIVQMPAGIPVASMAIDSAGAQNAVIFAAQVLGGQWRELAEQDRRERAEKVLEDDRILQAQGFRFFLK